MNPLRFVKQHAAAASLTTLIAITVINAGLSGLNYYLRRFSTTPGVAVTVTQPFLLASGFYCGDDANVRQRREQLSAILKGFENPSTVQRSIDDILMNASESTLRVFNMLDYSPTTTNDSEISSSNFFGVYLGGGYVVTVSHGVHNVADTGTIAGANGYPLFPINATTLLVENLQQPNQQQPDATRVEVTPAWSVTSFPQHDIALLYLPTQPASYYQFNLRSVETLAVGEKVYAVVRRDDSAKALEGAVEHLNVRFIDIDDSTTAAFKGHVLTTIPSEKGDSGSPVFDAFGNMVGLVSGGAPGISTAIAPIDSLLELALAEQQRLICRSEGGREQLQLYHKT